MTEVYEEFLVYDLENTGERRKLEIGPEQLQDHLNPEQVLIIVREDLRRIFIWKGAKSPVRKRFISSRVAQELQKELVKDPRYHRCKIVSIDQGEELQEFLSVFKLESMEVKEKLPDMRYIRNFERERMKEAERRLKEVGTTSNEEDYYSPGLENGTEEVVISSFAIGTPIKKGRSTDDSAGSIISPSYHEKNYELSREEKNKIKEKILAKEIPENYERQNLILGYTLYGAVSKVTEVFGENVVDITWEEVKKLPRDILELDEHKLRVYFNKSKGIIEAIEVLKKKNSYNNDSKELKKPTQKRQLPNIPRAED